MFINPLSHTCAQLDDDPLSCMPCENDEEDNEAVISTISDNYMPKNIIQVEDISRKSPAVDIQNQKVELHGYHFVKHPPTMVAWHALHANVCAAKVTILIRSHAMCNVILLVLTSMMASS